MTSNEILKRIKAKFAAPAYATFANVADSTGIANGRADAISMAAWKSRGYLLHGFEIKISRGDWLRELKQPAKTERLQKYCDHWWIVVSDSSIVRDDLPSTWGLMVANGSGLATVVKAPKIEPVPADREFLASLLRTAIYSAPAEPAAIGEARAEAVTAANKEWADAFAKQIKVIEELNKKINDFESASGINIRGWRGAKEVGEAVKFVMDQHGRANLCGQMKRLRIEHVRASLALRKATKALESLK